MRLIKLFLTFCGPVILAACFSLGRPAFDAEVIRNVDQGITLPLLQQNPEAFKGQTVFLGGQIVSANLTSESLVNIEVKQKPLDVNQKPVVSGSSQGVFLIQFPGRDLKKIIPETWCQWWGLCQEPKFSNLRAYLIPSF